MFFRDVANKYDIQISNDLIYSLGIFFKTILPERKNDKKDDAIAQPPETKGNEVENFFTNANSKKGVVMSTCTLHPAGCHDFGVSLKAQFENLDYMGVKVFLSDGYYQRHDNCTQPYTKSHAMQWETVFITGCCYNASTEIIRDLTHQYDLPALHNVYVVCPPHLSNKRVASSLVTLQQSFANTPYRMSFVTSGMNLNLTNSIGLPRPLPILESKFEVPKTCFGLMYNRHPDFLQENDGDSYLKAYFSEVFVAAYIKLCYEPTVIAIGIAEKDRIDRIAKAYEVTVEHHDRLPQADFLQVIKTMAANGGMVSVDGTQSMMQALYLGSRMLFYSTSGNAANCVNMIQSLPADIQPFANVILGQTTNYNRLNDHAHTSETYLALQRTVQTSVMKFEDIQTRVKMNIALQERTIVVTPDYKNLTNDNSVPIAFIDASDVGCNTSEIKPGSINTLPLMQSLQDLTRTLDAKDDQIKTNKVDKRMALHNQFWIEKAMDGDLSCMFAQVENLKKLMNYFRQNEVRQQIHLIEGIIKRLEQPTLSDAILDLEHYANKATISKAIFKTADDKTHSEASVAEAMLQSVKNLKACLEIEENLTRFKQQFAALSMTTITGNLNVFLLTANFVVRQLELSPKFIYCKRQQEMIKMYISDKTKLMQETKSSVAAPSVRINTLIEAELFDKLSNNADVNDAYEALLKTPTGQYIQSKLIEAKDIGAGITIQGMQTALKRQTLIRQCFLALSPEEQEKAKYFDIRGKIKDTLKSKLEILMMFLDEREYQKLLSAVSVESYALTAGNNSRPPSLGMRHLQ